MGEIEGLNIFGDDFWCDVSNDVDYLKNYTGWDTYSFKHKFERYAHLMDFDSVLLKLRDVSVIAARAEAKSVEAAVLGSEAFEDFRTATNMMNDLVRGVNKVVVDYDKGKEIDGLRSRIDAVANCDGVAAYGGAISVLRERVAGGDVNGVAGDLDRIEASIMGVADLVDGIIGV